MPTIDWQPCGDDFPGRSARLVDVPLDYDATPRGDDASWRWPGCRRATPPTGSARVFVNPGGPGGSGVGLVLGGFGEFLGDHLDGRFDVVGFDPRGVGASDPLHCFDSEEELDAFFAGLPVFPYQRDQYRPFFDHYRRWRPSASTTGSASPRT